MFATETETKTAAESRRYRSWALVVLCPSAFVALVVTAALATLANQPHAGTSGPLTCIGPTPLPGVMLAVSGSGRASMTGPR
jgi:hypothetical protein